MAPPKLALAAACLLATLAWTSLASTLFYDFTIANYSVNPLCQRRTVLAINNQVPGPTIYAHNGDTVVVHVTNNSPYNISLHWHGIYQKLSCWMDGPTYVTQCPIMPRNSFTYKFNIVDQEGTLWYHAHTSFLRETVYGALIIYPKFNYPFRFPDNEFPILLGEWWNADIMATASEFATGNGNDSDAFTINFKPGALYPNCPTSPIHTVQVVPGNTYLLRLINAALNSQLFFKIAGHSFTVVAVDASYTTPYITDVIVTGPGQTVDVLLTANQPRGKYYMAAHLFYSILGTQLSFDNTTTTAILQYVNAPPNSIPVMPVLPAYNDTATAFQFSSSLTSLVKPGYTRPVPMNVDKQMLITEGLGLTSDGSIAASMNNQSFVLPNSLAILKAMFYNIGGVYTTDFPSNPPLVYDYVNAPFSVWVVVKGTKVHVFEYGETVQIVLQNTGILSPESHPIHLHGFDFHVLAQGSGNYNSVNGPSLFNLVNPQIRNTIFVPPAGWAVIRVKLDNPGAWFFHCHIDAHMEFGLGTVFLVKNGNTLSTTLPPPPVDYPRC